MSTKRNDSDSATSAARDALVWIGFVLALALIFGVSVVVGYLIGS